MKGLLVMLACLSLSFIFEFNKKKNSNMHQSQIDLLTNKKFILTGNKKFKIDPDDLSFEKVNHVNIKPHHYPGRRKYKLRNGIYFNISFLTHTHIDMGWSRTIMSYYLDGNQKLRV